MMYLKQRVAWVERSRKGRLKHDGYRAKLDCGHYILTKHQLQRGAVVGCPHCKVPDDAYPKLGRP